MTRSVKGFTIIEVLLVMVITGVLFVTLTVGTSTNISRQRYNNAVQDFTEFLRGVYSGVTNPDNLRGKTADNTQNFCTYSAAATYATTTDANVKKHIQQSVNNKNEVDPASDTYKDAVGRTNCAVYGKVIIFSGQDDNTIYVFDVIGDIVDVGRDSVFYEKEASTGAVTALKWVYADFVSLTPTEADGLCKLTPAGNYYTYLPKWATRAEYLKSTNAYAGMVLIARSPNGGAISTFIHDTNEMNFVKFDFNSIFGNDTYTCNGDASPTAATIQAVNNKINQYDFMQFLTDDASINEINRFHWEEFNVCIGSTDWIVSRDMRRNIRIGAKGSDATAVELIPAEPLYSSENPNANKCGIV